MKLTKAQTDFIFLGILFILIGLTFYQCIYFGYVGSINNYLGVICWAIVLILRLTNNRFGRRSLAWLLILGTLNILNFTTGSATVSFGANWGDAHLDSPGLHPMLLLVLIAYYFVNKTSINNILKTLFRGSNEEQEVKHQKMVNFYIDKFSNLDQPEFEEIFNKIDNYPTEAQIALKQIRSQHR